MAVSRKDPIIVVRRVCGLALLLSLVVVLLFALSLGFLGGFILLLCVFERGEFV